MLIVIYLTRLTWLTPATLWTWRPCWAEAPPPPAPAPALAPARAGSPSTWASPGTWPPPGRLSTSWTPTQTPGRNQNPPSLCLFGLFVKPWTLAEKFYCLLPTDFDLMLHLKVMGFLWMLRKTCCKNLHLITNLLDLIIATCSSAKIICYMSVLDINSILLSNRVSRSQWPKFRPLFS